jgi:hypothetical protein
MNTFAAFARKYPLAAGLGLIVAAASLAACAYREGLGDNPITRSFSWFSYVNGDDIRSYCKGGGPDRYRIIYNGTAEEQVRTYEITVDQPAGGASLLSQYRGELDVSVAFPLSDPLKPWRAQKAGRAIGRGELRDLRDALRASGFDTPMPGGTRVYSWSFYWIAMACEGGRFTYNGWAYGTDRFKAVALAGPLLAMDPHKAPFTRPRETETPERDERGNREGYQLYLTPDGSRGHVTVF